MSEPRTLSGRLFQNLGDKYEKVLPPLVDFAVLGITKRPEFCDLRSFLCNKNIMYKNMYQSLFWLLSMRLRICSVLLVLEPVYS